MSHCELGQAGEEKAFEYLCSKKFEVLERNYKVRAGEIDIIAKKNKILFFFEVKTRRSLKYGYPEESVTWHKMKRITRAAQWYMRGCSEKYDEYHFDVISILMTDKVYIKHIQNAFEATC